jgi:hypothetical protein
VPPNTQVNFKVGFSGNVRQISITVPDPSARPATQQQQATAQPQPQPTTTAPLLRARPSRPLIPSQARPAN